MIKVYYDDGGVQQSLDLAIESMKDLRTVYTRYIGWRRKKVDAIFVAGGPGWKPLAKSTEEQRKERLAEVSERIRSRSLNSLSRRLTSERKRALSRAVKVGLRAQEEGEGGKATKQFARSVRTVGRHDELRRQFEEYRATKAGLSGKEGKRLEPRIARREGRAEQAIQDYVNGKQLGQIANSVSYEIKGNGVDEFSRIPWAGIHNKGGMAGNNAKIPERQFLALGPEDVAKLQEIAAEVLAEKLNGKKTA